MSLHASPRSEAVPGVFRRLGYQLASPLRVIYFGNGYYFFYIFVLISLCFLLVTAVEQISYHQLGAAQAKLKLPEISINFFHFVVSTVLWILSLPFLLAAVIVPVRSFYLEQALRLGSTISQTFRALQDGGRAVLVSLVAIFKVAIPGVAMGALYYFFLRRAPAAETVYISLGLTIALCIFSLYRALPLLAVPIIAITLGSSPQIAALHAKQLVRANTIDVLFTALLWALCTSGLHLSLHQFRFQLLAISRVEAYAHIFILWYFATVLAIPMIQTLVNLARAEQPQ